MAARAGEWWKEAVSGYGMRRLFHALCDFDRDDPAPVLDYASVQPWVAELVQRFSPLSLLDRTQPFELGDEELLTSLFLLYAASRVRDVLLLARQPPPLNASEHQELDEAGYRAWPSSGPIPIDRFAGFFELIGCQAVIEAAFDPNLHEIVTCEPALAAESPIDATGGYRSGSQW